MKADKKLRKSVEKGLDLDKKIKEVALILKGHADESGKMGVHVWSLGADYNYLDLFLNAGLAEHGGSWGGCPGYQLTRKAEKLYEQLKAEGFYENLED